MVYKFIKILCIFSFYFSLKNDLIISGLEADETIGNALKLPILTLVPPQFRIALTTFHFLAKLTDKKKDEVKIKDVISNLTVINNAIRRIEKRLDSQVQEISDEIINKQDIMDSETRIRLITDGINDLYDSMMENWDVSSSNETLLRHAIDYDSQMWGGVLLQLKSLVNEVVPTNRHKPEDGILKKIYLEMSNKVYSKEKKSGTAVVGATEAVAADTAAKKGLWCDNIRSFNNYIAHRYEVFIETITKGYLLLAGSSTIRHLLGNENTERDTLRLVAKYYIDMEKIRNATQEVIAESPLSIRRCDPQKHERGKTFIEFEKLEQGFLVHKLNLWPEGKTNIWMRRYPCSILDRFPGHFHVSGIEWTDRLAQIQCSGTVDNCWDARATSICLSETPSRRYDGFSSGGHPFDESPHTNGNMDCSKNSSDTIPIRFFDNFRPALKWVRYVNLVAFLKDLEMQHEEPKFELHTCACLCEDIKDPSSFRFVSQLPVWSDIDENMVVTGFKLVNDSNFLRIEIKQGKLGPYGSINISSNAWKPSTAHLYNEVPRILNRGFNVINLNTVTAPHGFAIVGVKFSVSKAIGDLPAILQLGIFTLPVTYSTGKLADPGMNLRYHTPKRASMELKIDRPALPTLVPLNKRNMEVNDKFIRLQVSDWEKDAAQSVVPFLDIQDVVTDPPILLRGLGFSYRSADGYGGFIGLEIQTWNFTRPLFGPYYNIADLLLRGNSSVNRKLFPYIYPDYQLMELMSDKPSLKYEGERYWKVQRGK